MRAATQIRGPLRLVLLAVLTWQAAAEDTHRIPDTSLPPSNEELSSSLVVNQLAILQLMQGYEELSSSLVVNQLAILLLMQSSSNASYAAAEMRSGRDGGREKTGGREEAVGAHNDRVLQIEARQQQVLGALNATTTDMLAHNDRVLQIEARQQQVLGALNATTTDMLAHNDRVLEMMEGRQQQMLGALNATTTDMLARIEGLRGEMREELTKAVQDVHIPASQSTQQPAEDTTAAVPGLEYTSTFLHNDTLPSLCNGNKILYGTVGTLEVVSGGTYSNYLQCSWELNFPQESSVNLIWDYIDIEGYDASSCPYDWVQVLDPRDSQLVYGRKLCGSLNPTTLKPLNVTVHGTRKLLVSFSSDVSNQRRGFRMTYQAHSRPS